MLNYRQDIQVLRGVSVLLVVIFHTRQALMPNGYIGVDIFFLISGFVLWPQINNLFFKRDKALSLSNQPEGKIWYLKFLKRRYDRLIPTFVISLIINLSILLVLSSYSIHKNMSLQAISSMFFIGNLGAETLVGNYFSPQPNPFMHLWSLSAEWQIYIFAPILIVLLKKLFPIKFTLALLLISALNLLIQILFELSINSYYSSFSRIWEFYFGVLTAIYLRKFSLSINSFQLLVIRLIGILSLMIIISPFEIRVIFSQFLGVIFFISFLISSPPIYTRINIVLLWLGDRSYSIYLYHFPLIYLSLQSPVSPSTFSFRVLGTAVSLISTLIIANWSYTKIEIPSIRNRK